MGASVRAGAAGSVAGISYSSISSTIAVGGQAQSIASVGQVVSNSGLVSNTSQIVGTGLTGAGSSASISALGAGASFSTSSIGDVSSAPLNSGGANVGVSVTQQVTNTGANTVNNGGISLGTGTLANGASASVSATGAQGAISVSSINTQSFTTPLLGGILQTVTNGGASASTVSNSSLGITTGDLSGHGASVSATASGAAASVGVSFINTPAWSSFPLGPVNQNATNTGSVTNGAGLNGQLSVGALSGTGASVRSSATGASASIAVTSILSGPPVANTFGSASMSQLATNTGAIQNTGTIVSSGTLSGMASSASITAVGAATSVALASINDTAVVPAPTATVMNITQTSNNLAGSPVANTGTITLAGGNLGAAAAASIGAVGASAAVSFLAVR
jgi:hypothetical protein